MILRNTKGFYFFPIITFVLILLLIKLSSWGLFILLILILLRILYLKEKSVLIVTVVAVISGLLFSITINQPSALETLRESKVKFQTFPDTVRVDGDLLTLEAREVSTKEKIIINYKLKSEAEKETVSQLRDTLIVTGLGSTMEIEGARNLNGFDYASYLEKISVSQKIKLDSVESVELIEGSGWSLFAKIKELRRRCILHNQNSFQPLTANYMNALLFGFKENTPDNFQRTWQALGVAHLFSLSGMHIYFFLFIFDFLFLSLKLTKERLFSLSLMFTIFLISVTGAGPGMMRAGLQYIVKKLNQRFSWELSPLDCWSIALLINTIFDPYVLLTVGGQLTYYLTFLIIFIQPLLRKIESGLKRTIAFNLLLSWLSLPLIWYHFHEWNLLNFILNLILSPLLFTIIMPLLLTVFCLSFLETSFTFLWLEKFLYVVQLLGDKANEWQLFQQVTGNLSFLLLILVLGTQFIWLSDWENGKGLWTKRSLFLFSLTCLVPFWKFLNPTGLVAFVDVGQGDAIFVQLPFHQGNYLLDTGGRLDFDVENWQKRSDKRGVDYTLIPFMKSQGVKQLDTVFISHAHEDHFGDLDRISESIQIKNLYFSSGSYEQDNFKRMLSTADLKKTQKKMIAYQDNWQKNGVSLDCLWPIEKGDGQNNDSLALRLQIKNKKILLVGDLEAEGEDKLLKQFNSSDLKADILKVGHHGSQTSSQKSFLDAVQPEVSIISCGLNNRYQHPSQVTLENLEEINSTIYRTDLNGMVYYNWSFYSKSLSEAKKMK